MLTIGRIAAKAAVSVDTVRYYEREGLLRPAQRTSARYRLYDDAALRRLNFIRQAQQCGFTLTEIRQVLELKASAGACCDDIRGAAVAKKLALEMRIRTLQAMSAALSELIATCGERSRPVEECPIVDALERHAGS